MKKILLLVVLLVPALIKAQDLKEYKAANGVTYHVNDTVRLGKGSNNNDSFAFIVDKGLGFPNLPGRSNTRPLTKDFANTYLIIKGIKKTKVSNVESCVFTVSGAGPFRLTMYIDEAVSSCEVLPCKRAPEVNYAPAALSVADEIKKLKDLMDSGAITKEEYEARKKKLLDQ